MEMSTKDINDDIQKYLDALFKLVQVMKVPGKKAKCKIDLILIHITSLLTP